MAGGKSGQATAPTRLQAIQLSQSAYGNCVPLVYGKTRIPITLIWYGDFTATPHSSGGGKGGGKGSPSSYTYSASIAAMICEGPINGIGLVYVDKDNTQTLSNLGLTLFSGSSGQATWSYLTGNYPTQAVPYANTAYVAGAGISLGTSAGVPNITLETFGLFSTTGLHSSSNDADPSAILIDYVSDPGHGCGFIDDVDNSYLDPGIQGAGAQTYQTYCVASNIFLSPNEDTQRQASQFIADVLKITNSEAVWSSGLLRIVPYGTSSVTSNGRTYTPNLTPLYSFTDDDYTPQPGEDPVLATRKPQPETYNHVRIEYLDRSTNYNTAIAEATDTVDINLNGDRSMSTLSHHMITDASTARYVAQLILQRQLYIRNIFTFRVRADYCLLEPMDFVSLNDSNLGLSSQLARILTIEDDVEHNLKIVAEEVPVGAAAAPRYNWQAAQGYAANYGVSPGSVINPFLAMVPSLMQISPSTAELWMGACGGPNWGGCNVWMSLDGGYNYSKVGTIAIPARSGTLTSVMADSSADPDTTSLLNITLDNTTLQMAGGSTTTANSLQTLVYVDGEILSFAYCTPTTGGTAGEYTFTSTGASSGSKYFRRAVYGSTHSAHAIGTQFCRIDGSLLRLPIDKGLLGQTAYFKFTSFNIYGGAEEQLASVTSYVKTLSTVIGGTNLIGFSVGGSNVSQMNNSWLKTGGTNGAWNAQIYSNEGYTAGAFCSAQASDTTGQTAFGLNIDPLLDTSYTSIDYCWLLNGGTAQIYENGSLVGSYGSYSTTVVFTITWDGTTLTYLKDGTVERTVPLTGVKLYLDSSFYSEFSGLVNLSFGPMGAAGALGPTTWTPNLVGSVAQTAGATFTKSSATTAWDVQVYSSEKYPACSAGAIAVSTTKEAAFGLSVNPAGDTVSYLAGMDYGFMLNNVSASLYIYESNSIKYTGTYAVGDTFSITYDSVVVRYYQNGALLRAVTAPGKLLSLDATLYRQGSSLTAMAFGPLNAANSHDLLTTDAWVVGSANVNQGNYHYYLSGTGAANNTVLGDGSTSSLPLGPYGTSDVLWRGTCNSTGGLGSGWNDSGDLQGIDPTKSYRTCIWLRYTGAAQTAVIYFGGDELNDSLTNLSPGTADSNPYFVYIPLSGLTADKWYLAVGVIHGSGYTGAQSGVSGIYDPATGQRVAGGIGYSNGANVSGGADFRFTSGVAQTRVRAFNYSSNSSSTKTFWTRPRFELMDGSEPSVAMLLSPDGALAYLDAVGTPNITNNAVSNLYSYSNVGNAFVKAPTTALTIVSTSSLVLPAQPYDCTVHITGSFEYYAVGGGAVNGFGYTLGSIGGTASAVGTQWATGGPFTSGGNTHQINGCSGDVTVLAGQVMYVGTMVQSGDPSGIYVGNVAIQAIVLRK